MPDDQVDQRYQQIQRRRSLDQHSLVTKWRGSFCTTLWRNNDFFVFGLVGTKHLLSNVPVVMVIMMMVR